MSDGEIIKICHINRDEPTHDRVGGKEGKTICNIQHGKKTARSS